MEGQGNNPPTNHLALDHDQSKAQAQDDQGGEHMVHRPNSGSVFYLRDFDLNVPYEESGPNDNIEADLEAKRENIWLGKRKDLEDDQVIPNVSTGAGSSSTMEQEIDRLEPAPRIYRREIKDNVDREKLFGAIDKSSYFWSWLVKAIQKQDSQDLMMNQGGASTSYQPASSDNLFPLVSRTPMEDFSLGGWGWDRVYHEVDHAVKYASMGGTIDIEDFVMEVVRSNYTCPKEEDEVEDDIHESEEEDDENIEFEIVDYSNEEILAVGEQMGTVNPGLSLEEIGLHMRARLYEVVSSSTERELCCICQEEYKKGDFVGSLDCDHNYHYLCISLWIEQNNCCPVCKRKGLSF